MARLLRIALVVVALPCAFAGGYLVKISTSFSWAATKPVAVAEAPPSQPGRVVAQTTVLMTRTVAATATVPHPRAHRDTRTAAMTVKVADLAPPPMPAPRAEPSTIILPPIAVAEPRKLEPVDPNDPGLRMIRDAMGIKTTVLDKAAPPPIVLADAKPGSEPDFVPPPMPMAGPPPKLESPRVDLDVPMIFPSATLLNSRAVELDFEVTRAGLSKVKAVELWATRDGGATWTKTDRMDGARPPFRTRLGSEGEYGFRMVFESEAGMRTPDPRPGQGPDLVMELDTTPPQIVIYAPVAGPPGTITLRWQTTDRHLDPDPSALRLEYSADGRTWQPIVQRAATPGHGSHDWVLPPGVPAKVLFRVTARDKAGNDATAVTNEKMSVDLVYPEGKVTAVRVQGREPEKGPMPRVVRAGSTPAGLVPAVLRSVLPVVLGSPLLFPSFAQPAAPPAPAPWDVTAHDPPLVFPPGTFAHDGSGYYSSVFVSIPVAQPRLAPAKEFVSAKEWLADLMKTDVAPEHRGSTPLPEILPPDAERAIALLNRQVRVYDPAEPEVEQVPNPFNGSSEGGVEDQEWRLRPRERTLPMREWRQTAEASFEGFTRGQTVLKLLTDRDWRPSTATPESYRHRVRTAGRDRPFGGAYDAGPGYWGSFSTPGVLLEI